MRNAAEISHSHLLANALTDAAVTWECMEMRAFGDAPPPRRRVGCARIGTDIMICGGTRYIYIPFIPSFIHTYIIHIHCLAETSMR